MVYSFNNLFPAYSDHHKNASWIPEPAKYPITNPPTFQPKSLKLEENDRRLRDNKKRNKKRIGMRIINPNGIKYAPQNMPNHRYLRTIAPTAPMNKYLINILIPLPLNILLS